MRTVTGQPGSLPALIEDRSLPHQIELLGGNGNRVSVSCTCLRRALWQPGARRGIIEERRVFPAAEAAAAWRAWHEEQRIEL
jgi:hypothetical protein